jgi:hypothetical protein
LAAREAVFGVAKPSPVHDTSGFVVVELATVLAMLISSWKRAHKLHGKGDLVGDLVEELSGPDPKIASLDCEIRAHDQAVSLGALVLESGPLRGR